MCSSDLEATQDKENSKLKSKLVDHDIIQLSNNFISKGLVPLEKLFDQNDFPKNLFFASPKNDIEDTIIGTDEKIKNIKICASLTPELKSKYVKLLKNYKYVFAWSYVELKPYDTSLIEHKIPLKPNVKPYQQKLRRMNPVLLPTIVK